MKNNQSLYEILNVKQNATDEEIKANFRKLAHIHHPDKNNNTKISEIIFKIIHNAYETLIFPEKRKAYDIYLQNTKIIFKAKAISKIKTIYKSNNVNNNFLDNLCNNFNFIFWEIEDILSKNTKNHLNHILNGLNVEKVIIKILVFVDKWVLEPSGFGDYFFKSRKIDEKKSYDYIKIKSINNSHAPYADINDYFYATRMRLDKFIQNIRDEDVLKKMNDFPITIIDNIFEAQRFSYHYLGIINLWNNKKILNSSKFNFSNKCYDDNYLSQLIYNEKK